MIVIAADQAGNIVARRHGLLIDVDLATSGRDALVFQVRPPTMHDLRDRQRTTTSAEQTEQPAALRDTHTVATALAPI